MLQPTSIPLWDDLPALSAEQQLDSEVRFILNVFYPDSRAALTYFETCEKRYGIPALRSVRDETRRRWLELQAQRRR